MGFRLGDLFKGLTGSRDAEGGADGSAQSVDHKGYTIRPAARREGSQWLTVGVISKQFDDGLKEQQFIRADMYVTKEDADACAITKGRQIIDEQGDDLFKDA